MLGRIRNPLKITNILGVMFASIALESRSCKADDLYCSCWNWAFGSDCYGKTYNMGDCNTFCANNAPCAGYVAYGKGTYDKCTPKDCPSLKDSHKKSKAKKKPSPKN